MTVQLNFDATQIKPASVGAGMFPVSDDKGWPVIIVAAERKPTKDNPQHQFLELTLQGIEGQVQGLTAPYRLNLWNTSQQAVNIAAAQLSAICHVIGQYRVPDASVLFGKPFRVVVTAQPKANPGDPDYTQIKGVKDIAGNDPGKSAGQQAAQPAPQQPQGQWGQAPAQPGPQTGPIAPNVPFPSSGLQGQAPAQPQTQPAWQAQPGPQTGQAPPWGAR